MSRGFIISIDAMLALVAAGLFLLFIFGQFSVDRSSPDIYVSQGIVEALHAGAFEEILDNPSTAPTYLDNWVEDPYCVQLTILQYSSSGDSNPTTNEYNSTGCGDPSGDWTQVSHIGHVSEPGEYVSAKIEVWDP